MTDLLDRGNPGDEITFHGYTSVSMNMIKTLNVVNWHGTGIGAKRMAMLEVHIPPGNRFLIIPSKENEIILPHFSTFKIIAKRQASENITYFVLEMVNDPTECSRSKMQ